MRQWRQVVVLLPTVRVLAKQAQAQMPELFLLSVLADEAVVGRQNLCVYLIR